MSYDAAVRAGRAAAQALMVDTFAAYEPNGVTFDGDGYEVPAFTAMGSTSGKVQAGDRGGDDTQARMVRIGDVERPVLSGGLHLPVGAPHPVAGVPGVGWEYVCTAVGPSTDPALLGKRFLVVGVPVKTHATALRLDVVEVS